MEALYQFRTGFIRISLLITAVISIAVSYVAVSYAMNKTIIVKDEVVEESGPEESVGSEIVSKAINPSSMKEGDTPGEISISLPTYINSNSVSAYARYDLNTLTITVPATHEAYLLGNPLSGDFSMVTGGEERFENGVTTFSFNVSRPFFFDLVKGGDSVSVKITDAYEENRPVIVIDPGHGGSSHGTRAGEIAEKDITLKIAKRVTELTNDKPYRVITTRGGDFSLSTADRIACVNAVDGDMYIGIHLSSDVDDVKNFGESASYNGTYFRNGLENADLADRILRNVAESSSNRALGIFEAGEEDVILEVFDIPATVLYCGYLSNETESSLLSNDEYIEKIAEGIVASLDELEK